MSNLTTTSQSFNLTPTTLEEAMKYAELIAKSSICPKDFKDKPGDVLVAIQMGMEVGLKPLQGIQNIAVINGRPSIWGDAALAIVKIHPQFEDINEWMEGKIEDGTAVAYCKVSRKGQTPQTRKFSVEDAKLAQLWGKPGPWQNYKARMLQMRARSFVLRDTFADALKGLILAEEAMDMPPTEKFMGDAQVVGTSNMTRTEAIKAKLKQEKESTAAHKDAPITDISDAHELGEEIVSEMIASAVSMEDLTNAADLAAKLEDPEAKKRLRGAFKSKKLELDAKTGSGEDSLPELPN